ncbi:response regulator transcription factor [Microbulbifer agarilyticus]|nr:response regulator transcription factor [Microbulbifer agarilyticus]
MHNILLVEDDDEIARLTCMYLEAEGYQVSTIQDGDQAIDAIRRRNPDLIILDLMLPGLSGAEICQQARNFHQKPILVLTACDDDANEIGLLKLGADDYLAKPLRPHVLTARIEALLRRSSQTHSAQEVDTVTYQREIDAFMYNGKRLELTDAEYDLLKLLYDHRGKAVSRETCCQGLRGIHYDLSDRSIDMRISGLRRKLGDDSKPYRMIRTVRNKGYLLNG